MKSLPLKTSVASKALQSSYRKGFFCQLLHNRMKIQFARMTNTQKSIFCLKCCLIYSAFFIDFNFSSPSLTLCLPHDSFIPELMENNFSLQLETSSFHEHDLKWIKKKEGKLKISGVNEEKIIKWNVFFSFFPFFGGLHLKRIQVNFLSFSLMGSKMVMFQVFSFFSFYFLAYV